MNIGLLVSELEDKEVKRICVGASQAARDKDITLVIMPGKYLIAEDEEDNPYDYQHMAVFDYADTEDFDALIIDIDRIGKGAPILKRDAFLNKFSGIPVLTLTKQEGLDVEVMSVNEVETDHDQFEQLGYEAVCDAVFYANNMALPSNEAAKIFSFVDKPESEALSAISRVGKMLLNRKYPKEKVYEVFAESVKKSGLNNCGIYLYDQKIRNSVKYWWKRPEHICVKSALVNGKLEDTMDAHKVVKVSDIISQLTENKPAVLVAGVIFVGEYQLGLLITEFTANMIIDYFFDTLLSVVTGASRVSYLEKELKKTNEELYEVQEELARDDSVLDHIGDQDYLTGGLNRRGFFAKAYDLLKEEFKEGSYAIVAYIHMESLKTINSMFGKEEGDRAVKRVALILKEVFEEKSIYGRIRGDEFAVLEITDEQGKAEFLREEMSVQNAKLLTDNTRYMNHLQYSICEFGHDENLSLREMLKETDENLQRIKGSIS
ncbi:MAG: GGDEF domain-containing protein [Butyrivibrio sp.]|nr:GGDEF domain-containing protein [Butyrivibrio sp.]